MNRSGTALVLALLVLLVLEGVVLGTVYISVQERRIADNGSTALRLRLAAESAARAAAGTWPAALDSLRAGAVSRETRTAGAAGVVLRTVYQRIDSALVLAFAEAAEPAPRAGRARAALLIQPPPFPESRIPDVALTAGADIAREWTALIARIAALLAAHGTDRGYGDGVSAVDGDLRVPANAALRGILLVNGSLVIEAGAVVDGVVVAAGPVDVQGTIRFSSSAAREAIRAAGLHRPRVYPLRSAVPAF